MGWERIDAETHNNIIISGIKFELLKIEKIKHNLLQIPTIKIIIYQRLYYKITNHIKNRNKN